MDAEGPLEVSAQIAVEVYAPDVAGNPLEVEAHHVDYRRGLVLEHLGQGGVAVVGELVPDICQIARQGLGVSLYVGGALDVFGQRLREQLGEPLGLLAIAGHKRSFEE